VDLEALARNFRFLRQRVGERAIYAVVKADAYGHGAIPVARRLAREGADRFAVAIAEEGVALRRAGIRGEILLLNFSEPRDVPLDRAFGLTPTLYELSQARAFARVAETLSEPLAVHLKIDTGMGRAGIRPEQIQEMAAILIGARGLSLAGTFTNFAAASDPASLSTAAQLGTMRHCLGRLRAAGVVPGLVHLANSAGILAHPESWEDGVRPGIALYGISPSDTLVEGRLEPVLTLETRVMAVSRVPAGTALGYEGGFVTSRPSTIVLLPIGYHDGYRRAFSGRATVLLRGREVPVVGAISMDLTLVDATECGAEREDRVVCLGTDGERRITAWDLARAAGTVPYEIFTGIGPRVRRLYSYE
jgi:alanine racemase